MENTDPNFINPKTLNEYRRFTAALQDPNTVPRELIPAFHRWAFANFMARRAQEFEMLAAQSLEANPADASLGQRWKFYQTQRIAAHKDAANCERAYVEHGRRLGYLLYIIGEGGGEAEPRDES
jgi:hypothetical protein